jgi:hypothetical protein
MMDSKIAFRCTGAAGGIAAAAARASIRWIIPSAATTTDRRPVRIRATNSSAN